MYEILQLLVRIIRMIKHMNNETLWEGWSLASTEIEEELPPLPEDTEVLFSPEKPDGSIFIYYRHAMSDSAEDHRYWSSVFNPTSKDTVSALLYPNSIVWTDDPHCAGVKDLLNAREDKRQSQVAMVSQNMHNPKTGMDYRFIDIWAARWNSFASGQLASFLARNVEADDIQMRVVSIHPENILPQEKNQTLFYGTLRRFRNQVVRAEE